MHKIDSNRNRHSAVANANIFPILIVRAIAEDSSAAIARFDELRENGEEYREYVKRNKRKKASGSGHSGNDEGPVAPLR